MNQTPIRKLLAFAINASYEDHSELLAAIREDLVYHRFDDAVITVLNHESLKNIQINYNQTFESKNVYETVFGVTEAIFNNLFEFHDWLKCVKAIDWKSDTWREQLIDLFRYAREREIDSCGVLAIAGEVICSAGVTLPPDLASLQKEGHKRYRMEQRHDAEMGKCARLMNLYHKLKDPEIIADLRNFSIDR